MFFSYLYDHICFLISPTLKRNNLLCQRSQEEELWEEEEDGRYLLKLCGPRRMRVQGGVLGRGGVLIIGRFLFVRLLGDTTQMSHPNINSSIQNNTCTHRHTHSKNEQRGISFWPSVLYSNF